jgi:large conductance mechanosensitive channel
MKKTIFEFIKFISKGNVVDLAVALMLGASFQKIVSSLVNHVLMPLVSWIVRADLSEWFITLQNGIPNLESELGMINPPSGWASAPIRIQFGLLVQSLIDFLMIALLLFLVVKLVSWSQGLREKVFVKVKQSIKEKHD